MNVKQLTKEEREKFDVAKRQGDGRMAQIQGLSRRVTIGSRRFAVASNASDFHLEI